MLVLRFVLYALPAALHLVDVSFLHLVELILCQYTISRIISVSNSILLETIRWIYMELVLMKAELVYSNKVTTSSFILFHFMDLSILLLSVFMYLKLVYNLLSKFQVI
jgi:hypothetical protein